MEIGTNLNKFIMSFSFIIEKKGTCYASIPLKAHVVYIT